MGTEGGFDAAVEEDCRREQGRLFHSNGDAPSFVLELPTCLPHFQPALIHTENGIRQ